MTRQDNLAHELRMQLAGLSCPSCGSDGLRLLLHCDYYPDGCLWLACCDSCQAQYHFDLSRIAQPEERHRRLQSTGERNPARAAI